MHAYPNRESSSVVIIGPTVHYGQKPVHAFPRAIARRVLRGANDSSLHFQPDNELFAEMERLDLKCREYQERLFLLTLQIPRPEGPWAPSDPAIQAQLDEAVTALTAAALEVGWEVHQLPHHDQRKQYLDALSDDELPRQMGAAIDAYQCESDGWHQDMLELGARRRRDVYAAMRPETIVMARRVPAN